MNDACAIVHDSVESDVFKNASVLTSLCTAQSEIISD